MNIEMQNILDWDYPKKSVDRVDADRFSSRQRGSVRLAMGRYRTEAEQEQYIRSRLSKPLPFPKVTLK
jgi:uncharacterized protein YfaP (DUF2135 family)